MFDKKFKTASLCGGVWSAAEGCVAVKRTTTDVQVQDTKTGEVQTFDHDEWRTFIDGVKRGEFDI